MLNKFNDKNIQITPISFVIILLSILIGSMVWFGTVTHMVFIFITGVIFIKYIQGEKWAVKILNGIF